MNVNGLTKQEIGRFEELLIKANNLQLLQCKLLVSSEIDKRERNKKLNDHVRFLRGGNYE